MRVGLLISEFKDKNVCDMCLGADIAARDLGVELDIFPGRYIITDKNFSDDNPYEYQHQAVFDYIYEAGFDGLIVDIEKIGSSAPILKKEAFLKQFGKKPLLTVSWLEGFDKVEYEKDTPYFEIGFLAIEQIISKISDNKVKAKRQTIEEFTAEDAISVNNRTSALAELASQCNYERDNYDLIIRKIADADFNNFEVYLLESPQICSL